MLSEILDFTNGPRPISKSIGENVLDSFNDGQLIDNKASLVKTNYTIRVDWSNKAALKSKLRRLHSIEIGHRYRTQLSVSVNPRVFFVTVFQSCLVPGQTIAD